MDAKTKNKLTEEVRRLVKETEGYEDALGYIGDIVTDVPGVTREDVVAELKKQFGRE